MSYSTRNVRAATVAALLAGIAVAFDDATKSQPVHVHDKQAHLESFERQVALLPQPKEGYEYSGSMNGYLSWAGVSGADGSVDPATFTTAGFGCSVSLVPVEVPKAA